MQLSRRFSANFPGSRRRSHAGTAAWAVAAEGVGAATADKTDGDQHGDEGAGKSTVFMAISPGCVRRFCSWFVSPRHPLERPLVSMMCRPARRFVTKRKESQGRYMAIHSRGAQPVTARPSGGLMAAWKTVHILVVDDDRDIRQLVGDYLRQNGFRVSLAAEGREMREALDATH